MIKLVLVIATLVVGIGAAQAWIAQVPAGSPGVTSCVATLTTSSGSDIDNLTATATVVNSLTCN